ncbi:HepT-like ribonuclease domain-containing protein [Burkholderia sp. MR1-5-21]
MRTGIEFCGDIRFSIECIAQYLGTQLVRGFAGFVRKEQDAACYRLLIIGEAAKRLIARHPDGIEQVSTNEYDLLANLTEAARMRDRMIHRFWDTNYRTVFETICNDLPKLTGYINRLGATLAHA